MARPIGAMPVSSIGTALIRLARSGGDSDASEVPDALAASCSNPIATGDRPNGLAQEIRQGLFALWRRDLRDQVFHIEIGPQRLHAEVT